MIFLPTPLRNVSNWVSSWVFAFAFEVLYGSPKAISDTVNHQGAVGQAIKDIAEKGVDEVINALKPFGFSIVIVFFLMHLIDLLANEQFTQELFIKSFAKFGAAYALVYYSNEIASVAQGLNEAFANTITNIGIFESTTQSADILGQIKTALSSKVFGPLLEEDGGYWIILIVMSMMLGVPMIIVGLGVTVVAYTIEITRQVELMIRSALIPIAFALWAEEGFRGGAGRYIKKYLALLCQGGVLIIIAGLTAYAFEQLLGISASGGKVDIEGGLFAEIIATANSASDEDEWNIFGQICSVAVGVIGLGVGSVAIMRKSIGIINDAFGV